MYLVNHLTRTDRLNGTKDYYCFAVMSMIIIKQEASVSCFCLVEFVDRKQVGGRLFEIRTSLIDKVKLLL